LGIARFLPLELQSQKLFPWLRRPALPEVPVVVEHATTLFKSKLYPVVEAGDLVFFGVVLRNKTSAKCE
jgi:hypothetical protein